MKMTFYDAVRKKEVEIEPRDVAVVLEKDSDGGIYIKTVVRSGWDWADDVVVYIGRNVNRAFARRMTTSNYIVQENDKNEQ